MRILLITCLIGVSVSQALCQQKIIELPIRLGRDLIDRRDVLPLVSKGSEISLFLMDNNSITGVLLNKSFESIGQKEWPKLKNTTYTEMAGGFSSGDEFYIVFSNKNHSKFLAYNTSFVNDELKTGNFELPSNEKYLGSFTLNNRWYISSILKRSSIIKFYEFSSEKDVKILSYDFSEYTFDSTWPHLIYAFGVGVAPGKINVAVIDYESPKSLTQTSCPNKLYFFGTDVVLTIEKPQRTIVLQMNLLNGKLSKNDFRVSCDLALHNSFLFYNRLFQGAHCDDFLSLRIIDVATKLNIQDFAAREDEEILFKNGPLIQEGGGTIYSQGREFETEKTKQFFRKMGGGELAISVHQRNNNVVEMTMGSVKEFTTPMYSSVPVTTGVPGYSSMYIPGQSYNSYSWSRTNYFKSLFNKDTFEHLEGTPSETEFDKMKNFEEGKNFKITTNFKFENNFIYGHYDGIKKVYVLYNFSN